MATRIPKSLYSCLNQCNQDDKTPSLILGIDRYYGILTCYAESWVQLGQANVVIICQGLVAEVEYRCGKYYLLLTRVVIMDIAVSSWCPSSTSTYTSSRPYEQN